VIKEMQKIKKIIITTALINGKKKYEN